MGQSTNSNEPVGEVAPTDEQEAEEKTYPAKVVRVYRVRHRGPTAKLFSRYPY